MLVFDNLGRDVISSVLRVNDLRSWGVTIHLYVAEKPCRTCEYLIPSTTNAADTCLLPRNVNTARHTIPDVPVIYLVEPTPANIKLLTSDLERGLYSPAYINFLSSVPRPLLEDFASQIATAGVAEHIAQVYDQYLNFIVSEPDLFSLGMGLDTYWAMNGNKVQDEVVDETVDRIVSGLFSVVVTMGSC